MIANLREIIDRCFRIIVLVIIVGLVIGIILGLYGAVRQRAANARAEEYAKTMQAEFSKDTRFQNVEIERFSGFGAVRISGYVSTAIELAELKKQVESNIPSLAIFWKVGVEAETQPTTTSVAPAVPH